MEDVAGDDGRRDPGGQVAVPGTDRVDDLLGVATDLAREAGAHVLAGRLSGVSVSAVKSSPVDVVTDLDTAAERRIRESLALRRPDDGVLGEEYGHRTGTSGLTWLVDPIAGTVNFLYGIARYSVSIAVGAGDPTRAGGWETVAGCVHAPAEGRTFSAGLGRGAWLTDERLGRTRRLAVNAPVPLAQSLVGTGFGYRARRRAAQAQVLTGVLPRVRDIRRMGGAALDLCAVATGELDAYYERGLGPWDLAAGRLVVTEAGGRVTGLRGEPPGAVMTLAGPEHLVTELAELLQALEADAEDEVDDTAGG